MNKITLIFIFLLVISCGTQKLQNTSVDYSKGIPYILPGKVQNLLDEKVKNMEEPLYFLFDKKDINTFFISINKYDLKTFKGANWIKNTNRYVYLKGKYYPLIFEYDQLFSTPKTAEEFLKDVDPDGSYTHSTIYILNEYSYRVEFNIRGEILYEGYDSILKEK